MSAGSQAYPEVSHPMLSSPISELRNIQTQEVLLWEPTEFAVLCCSLSIQLSKSKVLQALLIMKKEVRVSVQIILNSLC